MGFRLDGTYFENCTCNMVCPCTTSGFSMAADYDRCRALLAFHVDSGQVDDVDVSGLTVAVFVDSPPVMAEGNWRVGLLMDAAASEKQAQALTAVFSGQKGGPMEMLAPLIGEMLGVETMPMEFVEDGRRHRLRAGDAVDIEIEDFVPPLNPEGEVSKLTGMFHPANSTLTIARATSSRMNLFGLSPSTDGQNAHSAPFSWAA
jgi:hypothetical protein